ncbi:hypothetical protein HDG37_007732, partial [Paraburkholderia sp. MM5384-R2]|nr:hypothetical protein [Paraburkholderia sp. MM5384-R2]
MAKVFELLINIVNLDGPKTLIGPTQNGNVAGLPFIRWGSADMVLPVEKQSLNHSCERCG